MVAFEPAGWPPNIGADFGEGGRGIDSESSSQRVARGKGSCTQWLYGAEAR